MSPDEMQRVRQMRLQRLEQSRIPETKKIVQENEKVLDTSTVDLRSLNSLVWESDSLISFEEMIDLTLDVRPFVKENSIRYNLRGFSCPKLRKLKIIETKNPSEEDRQIVLGTFRSAKSLETLDASGNNLNVMDMLRFVQPASSGSLSVKVMNLQNNKIKSVPKLVICPNLEVLNLNYNDGDDAGVPEDKKQYTTDVISFLENNRCSKLRELHIVRLNLDRSIDQMWSLPDNVKLIEMDTKWLSCIPKDRIKNTVYSTDKNSVTMHLK